MLIPFSIILFCIILLEYSFVNQALSLDKYEKETIEEKNIKELLILKQVNSGNKNSEKYLYICFMIARHYFEKNEFEKAQNEFEFIISQPRGLYFGACNCYLGKIYQTQKIITKAYKSYDVCIFSEDNFSLMMFSSDSDYLKINIQKIAKKEHKRIEDKLQEQIINHYKNAESQLAKETCEDVKYVSICEDISKAEKHKKIFYDTISKIESSIVNNKSITSYNIDKSFKIIKDINKKLQGNENKFNEKFLGGYNFISKLSKHYRIYFNAQKKKSWEKARSSIKSLLQIDFPQEKYALKDHLTKLLNEIEKKCSTIENKTDTQLYFDSTFTASSDTDFDAQNEIEKAWSSFKEYRYEDALHSFEKYIKHAPNSKVENLRTRIEVIKSFIQLQNEIQTRYQDSCRLKFYNYLHYKINEGFESGGKYNDIWYPKNSSSQSHKKNFYYLNNLAFGDCLYRQYKIQKALSYYENARQYTETKHQEELLSKKLHQMDLIHQPNSISFKDILNEILKNIEDIRLIFINKPKDVPKQRIIQFSNRIDEFFDNITHRELKRNKEDIIIMIKDILSLKWDMEKRKHYILSKILVSKLNSSNIFDKMDCKECLYLKRLLFHKK